MKDYIRNQIKISYEIKHKIYNDDAVIEKIARVSKVIIRSYKKGGKVLLAGNGGSAGDAQHIAGELVNKFNFDRPGLPAIALSTDTSVLTAIGNDYSFEKIFSKQLEANSRKGDIFLGISTSGNSKNIVEAMKFCRKSGIITIGLTGNKKGKVETFCDYIIKVPSSETPRIQEAHVLIYHIICGIVEESIFGKGKF